MSIEKYRDLFVVEAQKHLAALSDELDKLAPDCGGDCLCELYRRFHSLKGMAATMQFDGIAMLSCATEDLLARVIAGECPFGPDIAGLVGEAGENLAFQVSIVADGAGSPEMPPASLLDRLQRRIEHAPG